VCHPHVTTLLPSLRSSGAPSRTALLAAAESSGDLVAILSADARIEWVNRAGLDLLGVDAGAELRLGDLVPQHTYEDLVLVALPAAAERGRSWTGEATLQHPDGDVPVALTIAHHTDGDGTSGYVLLARDLREEHRLAAELRESREMEAIGRLAGGVAHDFNDVLTAIMASAELLLGELDGSALAPQMRAELESIRRAADRGATLSRQIVAYSRRQMPQPRVLALSDIVRNMDTTLRRQLGASVSLELGLAGASLLRADPSHVEQVVLHLATAASLAAPTGSTLLVGTADVESPAVFTHAHGIVPPGSYVSLVVREAAMPASSPGTASAISFVGTEPNDDASRRLATVYGMVRHAGGYVWGHRGDGGLAFTVYFPRHADRDAAPAASATPRATVLLVDDEALVRKVAAKSLRRRGYTVLEAASGAEALALAASTDATIDVLLTDIAMPRMTGAELAHAIRGTRPSVKVIYASGAAPPTDRGTPFLQKPFTIEMLEERLREALAER
jgi:CheY-like chemotaxis protein/signal transduction histidine kinase